MNFSDTTENIFKAMAGFRKEIIQPKKDADNPQFRSKYVPLESVTDVIDKVAPKHGLAYFQNVKTGDDDTIGVQTVITHESGEYVIFDWLMLDSRPIVKGGSKGMATSQSQGSAITYGRRYSLSGAFGIASEVDDDGNQASGEAKENKAVNNVRRNKPDPHLEGKQNFLAEKAPLFEKFGMSKGTFYAGLGQRLGVEEAIQAPHSEILETTKRWLKELEDESGNKTN